jgi:CysZ protein
MFDGVFRAIEQLDDPVLLRIVAQSIVLSAACFALLAFGSAYELHHALAPHGWVAWLAGALGGVATVVAAIWLFLPLAVVIASAFSEAVCRAVERRWYPALPPAAGASLFAAFSDSLVLAGLVLVFNVLGLVLAVILPGVGLIIGWAVAAWALGRGWFVAVAMRRMDRRAATNLYEHNRWRVVLQGAALTLIGTVPLVNLLLPVLGPAAMVHEVMRAHAEGLPEPRLARDPQSWG